MLSCVLNFIETLHEHESRGIECKEYHTQRYRMPQIVIPGVLCFVSVELRPTFTILSTTKPVLGPLSVVTLRVQMSCALDPVTRPRKLYALADACGYEPTRALVHHTLAYYIPAPRAIFIINKHPIMVN